MILHTFGLGIGLLLGSYMPVRAQTGYQLQVQVEGLKEEKGQLILTLYNTPEHFLSTPFKNYKVSKKQLFEQQNSYTIPDLALGEYVLMLHDDENMNEEMDRYFFGMPKEGYGMSNLRERLYRKPRYKESVFQVQRDTTIQVLMFY